jgi:diguanylate cyclase (GGDEF)-like protein/PAS domain S-box-containing protein
MKIRFSLRYRIVATIFLLEAVLVAVVLWQTVSSTLDAIHAQQVAHEEMTITPLLELSRMALFTEEFGDIQPYIRQVAHKNDVTHIVLADSNDLVVASTEIAEVGHPLPPLVEEPDQVWRVREIGDASGKMGTLATEFSNAALLNSLRRARNHGITIALAGMSIIAVVSLIMGHLLTRRLGILARAAQRVASGELDVQTGLQGHDEVAEVGHAFDQMAQKVQSHIAELRQRTVLFSLAVSGSNDGIWDWNLPANTVYFSPRCREILGFTSDDPEFDDDIEAWKARVHTEDLERVSSALDGCLRGAGDFVAFEHRLRRKCGEYVWVLMRGKLLRDDQGQALRMTGSLTDITERKRQEVLIRHQALHDAVTGLPNRVLLRDRLEHAMTVSGREGRSLGVLMMDLDRFKEINDTLGHHIGDLVLQQVAVRLRGALRASDTVSRFGGDEFSMVLPGADEDECRVVAGNIASALAPIFIVDGYRLHVDASIGAALYPRHGQDPTTLIKLADVAMYAAKRTSSSYMLYDPRLDRHSPERLAMRSALHNAIAHNRLTLYYQPKINLHTGKMVGVEALVRWAHPDRGLLAPDAFIPLAEQSGLITSITTWVLDAVVEQHHAWKRAGLLCPIAVNVSARSLQDTAFPQAVGDKLAEWHMAPEQLQLEITESAIMADAARASKILLRLSQMGIGLAIDDFGTGYSSLAYLKRLPVSELKIDRSFVTEMAQDEDNRVIVHSTVDLGHNLGLRVVAEGVENAQTRDLLAALGCDVAQGHYLGAPMTAEQLLSWAGVALEKVGNP